MSAAQMQNDGEQRWGVLDSLGLSPKELVMAEALQMEYDALSRLRQDKSPTSKTLSDGDEGGSKPPPPPQRELPLPPPRPLHSPPGSSFQTGGWGSDPMLQPNGNGQSGSSHAQPPMSSKEPLYILETGPRNKGHSDGLPPPDEPPPALPPRNPLPPLPDPPRRPPPTPRDINLFSPEVDQPKVLSSDTLNYDHLNDSLTKLNGDWSSPRGRRGVGEQAGKPVARSKTLPPQVPPRSYLPAPKSGRTNRRVSADPVKALTFFYCIIDNKLYICCNLKKWRIGLFLLDNHVRSYFEVIHLM